MPRRPRQHVIEDFARAALRDTFAGQGWTTEDLNEDYGLDMLVRVFERGKATPWCFFVQSKATEQFSRLRLKDGRGLSF